MCESCGQDHPMKYGYTFIYDQENNTLEITRTDGEGNPDLEPVKLEGKLCQLVAADLLDVVKAVDATRQFEKALRENPGEFVRAFFQDMGGGDIAN